jgi:DNA polymerase-3 subunit gamma/tau
VKFIFATTEIRKVPVTVLSRCQRFDLRRVEVGTLSAHFRKIVDIEQATAEDDALGLIARAAEGSVRDGLSILDQAIAMGAGNVTSEAVREMIGLADRSRVFTLLTHVLSGQAKDALALFDELYRDGADPAQLLRDLAETTHLVTKAKTAGAETLGDEFAATDKERAAEIGGQASLAILSRAWQMLVKGLDEASRAPNAKTAAEMVLIRLAYTADLPTPDELMRALGGGPALESGGTGPGTEGGTSAGGPAAHATHVAPPQARATASAGSPMRAPAPPRAQSAPQNAPTAQTATIQLASFDEVIAFVREQRDAKLLMHLEDQVRLVAFEPGRIEINLLPDAPQTLAGDLGAKLSKWTGARWIVTVSRSEGAEPVGAVRRRREAAELAELKDHPAVKAVLSGLPNVEIETVRTIETLVSQPVANGNGDDLQPIDDGEDDDETD